MANRVVRMREGRVHEVTIGRKRARAAGPAW